MSLSASSICRCARRLAVSSRNWRHLGSLQQTQCSQTRDLSLRKGATTAGAALGFSRQLHFSSSQGSGSITASEVRSDEEMVPERLYSKVVIKVKGADFRVLESYCRFVITAAKALDINIGGRVALPTRIQKYTVLKSIHIFKKHRVQYEIRTHMRLMQIKEITGTTADVFLEYIQRNLPEGVSMSVNQEKMDTLPALLMSPPEGEEAATSTSQTTRPKPTKGKK